jgi:Protein of unknown function (DUF3143)
MTFPPASTPLYNHPLNIIEQWLAEHGCQQDRTELHCWLIHQSGWKAELWLEVDQLTVRYFDFGDGDREIQRSFKYSLSRQDLEDAIFSGP